MKPKITFDKSADNFVLKAFGMSTNKHGYIVGSNHEMVNCRICGNPIHIQHFAGVVNDLGVVCNNITCLMNIVDKIGVNPL